MQPSLFICIYLRDIVLISVWNYREIDKSLFIIDQTMVPIWIPIVTARDTNTKIANRTYEQHLAKGWFNRDDFPFAQASKTGKNRFYILIHEDASSNVKFMFNPGEYQRNSRNCLYLVFYSFSFSSIEWNYSLIWISIIILILLS